MPAVPRKRRRRRPCPRAWKALSGSTRWTSSSCPSPSRNASAFPWTSRRTSYRTSPPSTRCRASSRGNCARHDAAAMTRVLVTGLGAVSPFGNGVKAFWSGLSSGTCAIRPVTVIDAAPFRSRIAAEVPDVPGASRRRSRADRLALAAAREAVEDAGLTVNERENAALIVGAVGGGMLEAEAWYWTVPPGAVVASNIPALRAVLPASHVDMLGHRLG